MNKLKQLREERNMKQSELGKLLNVKEPAISKYESEKVLMTSDILLKLSSIFNVSIDYILDNKCFLNKPASSPKLDPLDEEIIKCFHSADTFDQVAILRILNIKKKIPPLRKAK